MQTRDEYFYGQGKFRKPGYENKANYRKVVVVDSNREDELAVVKLTTSDKGILLPNYKKGKSKYRPYILTKDEKGQPIKPGRKFVDNPSSEDVSSTDVNIIKKDCISNKITGHENRNRLKKLKKR